MGLKDKLGDEFKKVEEKLAGTSKTEKPEAAAGKPEVEEKAGASEAESKAPAATLAHSEETDAVDAVKKTETKVGVAAPAAKAAAVDEAEDLEEKAATGAEAAKKAVVGAATAKGSATAVEERPGIKKDLSEAADKAGEKLGISPSAKKASPVAAATEAGAAVRPAAEGPALGVQPADAYGESENMNFPINWRGRTNPPETEPCNPCTDLITAAKRVLRDPKVNQGISDWLLQAAKSDSSPAEKSKNQTNLARAQEAALTSFANAVAGRDAVRAESEPCRGQVRLFVEFLPPLTPGQTLSQQIAEVAKQMENGLTSGTPRDVKRLELNRQAAKKLNFQLLDDHLRVAQEGNRTYDEQGGILVSQVEAGNVFVGLQANVFGGAEFIADFLATQPGGSAFTHYTSVPPSVGSTGDPVTLAPLTQKATQGQTFSGQLVAAGGVQPYTFSIISGEMPPGLSLNSLTGTISGTPTGDSASFFTTQVMDSTGSTGTADCRIDVSQSGDIGTVASGRPGAAKEDDAARKDALSSALRPSKLAGPAQRPGTMLPISAGMETRAVLFLRPPAARVRCFSFMEGDDCCGKGNQYISRVTISALQGDNFIACKTTGASGCSGFELSPGMYTFSAPREIVIGGCNYTLASSSPVSAFLGAGQCCSDIYFNYKKKGNEIQVISEIDSALGGDPYVPAEEDFSGMQYLLLQEGNPGFAQQQTTSDGSAVCFRNLAAGTYLLFCQAPATYGSQPVTPVYPADGRLSLRVFAGQTSAVPVKVKFRTSTTAPAVLSGYVRDDTGTPVPQQVVQVLNNANCLVAAGLTDANGFYSIQIYKPENLTLVVGSQQVALTQSQIQAAMQTVGTPTLPSPGAVLSRAVQTSELVTTY